VGVEYFQGSEIRGGKGDWYGQHSCLEAWCLEWNCKFEIVPMDDFEVVIER